MRSHGRPGTPSTTPTPHRVRPGSTPSTRTETPFVRDCGARSAHSSRSPGTPFVHDCGARSAHSSRSSRSLAAVLLTVRVFDTLPVTGTTGINRHATVGRMKIMEGAGTYRAPRAGEANDFTEILRVPDMSVGTYSIPAGGTDDQSPHTEDEIYVVTAGRARFEAATGSREVRA